MESLLPVLEARGANSVRVTSLLEKRAELSSGFKGHYVGFSIPDKFVVGYCLDFNEIFRCVEIAVRAVSLNATVGLRCGTACACGAWQTAAQTRVDRAFSSCFPLHEIPFSFFPPPIPFSFFPPLICKRTRILAFCATSVRRGTFVRHVVVDPSVSSPL